MWCFSSGQGAGRFPQSSGTNSLCCTFVTMRKNTEVTPKCWCNSCWSTLVSKQQLCAQWCFFASIFRIAFLSCLGIRIGGGCVERRSPGPALPSLSAASREQEAAADPSSQRAPHPWGRIRETGGWVPLAYPHNWSLASFFFFFKGFCSFSWMWWYKTCLLVADVISSIGVLVCSKTA